MHVALVAHGLPQPSSNGGPMTCYALLRQLQDEGHDVAVVALRYPGDPFVEPEREAALGVDVVAVPVDVEATGAPGTVPLRGEPTLGTIFPTTALQPRLREALAGLRPDVVFAYHWDTLAALHGVDVAPRFGVVDDPWHAPNLRRWQTTRPRLDRGYAHWTLSTLRGVRPVQRAMRELLTDCEDAASFQSRTASDLGVDYVRAPIVDYGGPEWRSRRKEDPDRTLRVLVGPSNLGATSTRAGLAYFARHVLRDLEADFEEGGLLVRIVGEGEPPPELFRMLPRPTVELAGRVEPADDEFLQAHAQLVPTPFVLGKRVRIIVAWTFGTPVVAHTSEAKNLPELRHRENAMLGAEGSLVSGLLEADEELGARGRETYERLFHPSVAGHALVERLERLVTRRRAKAAA